MDAVMAERVNKLARSLKDLHLAMTIEEAYKRAEEILLVNPANSETHAKQSLAGHSGIGSASEEKSLNELMAEELPQDKNASQTKADAQVEEIIIAPQETSIKEKSSDASEQQ